jgi:CRP-like cAMP-binding protein
MIRINKELVDFVARLYRVKTDDFISEQAFGPKKVIIEQGTKSRFAYIIKSGIAKCYLSNENGTDFIQEFFGEGEIFGEVEIFNNEESFCSVETITDLVLYKIRAQSFFRLLEENPKFNSLILKALVTKVKYKAVRHAFNQSNRIETNLLRLVEQFPELFETIPKQDIAGYLGITERSLNRAIKSLKDRRRL